MMGKGKVWRRKHTRHGGGSVIGWACMTTSGIDDHVTADRSNSSL